MHDPDMEFLKEVFKETNSHLRATERKSLVVTGAYIGLFSIFLSSFANIDGTGYSPSPWLQVAVQVFFLIVGSCIYLMQQWYRAWKEHYIDVSFEISKRFMPEADYRDLLPYWLRVDSKGSRISIDNLLKYLTATINFVIVFIICYELLDLLTNQKLAILIVAVLILSYIGLLYVADRVIGKNRMLVA